MTVNQKLFGVLKGKALASMQVTPSAVTLHFADGAVMTVQGTGPAVVATKGAVKSVSETGAALGVAFDDGVSVTITMADPGGSVMVRDKGNRVIYAG